MFLIGEYNKLAAKTIKPLKIIEKINLNDYRLKHPSHFLTFYVFNAKHLVHDVILRENSLELEENDIDWIARGFMKRYEQRKNAS